MTRFHGSTMIPGEVPEGMPVKSAVRLKWTRQAMCGRSASIEPTLSLNDGDEGEKGEGGAKDSPRRLEAHVEMEVEARGQMAS